jgi:hypothetical protein
LSENRLDTGYGPRRTHKFSKMRQAFHILGWFGLIG